MLHSPVYIAVFISFSKMVNYYVCILFDDNAAVSNSAGKSVVQYSSMASISAVTEACF